jgi:hypothetical protein
VAREPSEPGQEIGCERIESLARIFSAIAAIVFGSPGFAPQAIAAREGAAYQAAFAKLGNVVRDVRVIEAA